MASDGLPIRMPATARWPEADVLSCRAPDRRAAGIDVEAQIVDHGLAKLAHDLLQEGLPLVGFESLKVRAQADGAQVGLKRLARGERRWLGLQPAAHIDEAGRAETALSLLRCRKIGRVQVDTGGLGRRMDAGNVAGATALGNQLPAGPQHRRELRKQGLMVMNPVIGSAMRS